MRAPLLLLLLLSTTANAQTDTESAVNACRRLPDDPARLKCYDNMLITPQMPGTKTGSESRAAATSDGHERALKALDRHLADTLKDPASAIQYAVSGPLSCRDVSTLKGDCLCYRINARNAMGGMTGQQVGVAIMYGDTVRNVLEQRFLRIKDVAACEAAGLIPRSAANIHAAVE